MAYSDIKKSEALIKLAINKGDYAKTAKDTGIARKTLIRWAKNVPKKGVPELLDRAIERMLMLIPAEMNARDWGIALGILMDKWLLAQGMATSRTENLFQSLSEMPDEELNELVREFENAARSSNAKDGTGAKK
jgi:hypothetical protein